MQIIADKLKRKKRLNVQEQLILKKDNILKEAMYWKLNGIPKPLEKVFSDKGINIDTSIFLDYSQDFPGLSTDEGILLTQKGEFFEFEADLNPERNKLIKLYSFINITNKFEISSNKKGVKKTYGCLAIEVLNELNQNRPD